MRTCRSIIQTIKEPFYLFGYMFGYLFGSRSFEVSLNLRSRPARMGGYPFKIWTFHNQPENIGFENLGKTQKKIGREVVASLLDKADSVAAAVCAFGKLLLGPALTMTPIANFTGNLHEEFFIWSLLHRPKSKTQRPEEWCIMDCAK